MGKLTRYTQLLFGSSASANQISEFGSLAAGSPQRYSGSTITPAIVQGLANYLQGWFGAVEAVNSPPIEDMNALCYLYAYQLAYLMQQGIAEYDSATPYFTNSLCTSGGVTYISLQNNNIGNALTNSSFWNVKGAVTLRVSTDTNLAVGVDIYESNSTSMNLVHQLPALSSVTLGQKFIVKDIGTGGFNTSLLATSPDVIDGSVEYQTASNEYDSVTVSAGTEMWNVI